MIRGSLKFIVYIQMSFVAASVQQGLTTYAAQKWVENFDSVMRKLFDFDQDNLVHTVLYALLLTFMIVIFSRLIDDFIRPDDEDYYRYIPQKWHSSSTRIRGGM